MHTAVLVIEVCLPELRLLFLRHVVAWWLWFFGYFGAKFCLDIPTARPSISRSNTSGV